MQDLRHQFHMSLEWCFGIKPLQSDNFKGAVYALSWDVFRVIVGSFSWDFPVTQNG